MAGGARGSDGGEVHNNTKHEAPRKKVTHHRLFYICFSKTSPTIVVTKQVSISRYLPDVSSEELVRQIAGTSSDTRFFIRYQVLHQIPGSSSDTRYFFRYQVLLQTPVSSSEARFFFRYKLLLQRPISSSDSRFFIRNQVPHQILGSSGTRFFISY